jgi:hypothetical protein
MQWMRGTRAGVVRYRSYGTTVVGSHVLSTFIKRLKARLCLKRHQMKPFVEQWYLSKGAVMLKLSYVGILHSILLRRTSISHLPWTVDCGPWTITLDYSPIAVTAARNHPECGIHCSLHLHSLPLSSILKSMPDPSPCPSLPDMPFEIPPTPEPCLYMAAI